jgi:RNA polymerase sigma factor (TIGR02999 family)
MEKSHQITQWLNEISKGSDEAYNKLFPVVYDQLRNIACRQIMREPKDNTYTKTALVHEAYLKLVNQDKVVLNSRTHFFAIAARSMRQILIDHARKKTRKKRGGKAQAVTFIDEIMKVEHQAEELIQIDKALDKLAAFDERLARIVELHYFGEMNFDDIGEVLNLSSRTVYRDWAKARGWLYKELR